MAKPSRRPAKRSGKGKAQAERHSGPAGGARAGKQGRPKAVPPELAFVRACGPGVRDFAAPIRPGREPRPFDEVRHYGELALLQFGLVDADEWRGPRATLYRALAHLLDPDPPPRLPEVLAALRAVAAPAARPEYDWLEGVWRAETGGDLAGLTGVALAGAVASLVRRGDPEALERLRASDRDSLASVLAGSFGTLLAVPVLAALAPADPALVREVLATRAAPVVRAPDLMVELFAGWDEEAAGVSLSDLHGDMCRRWADWCDAVGRGALLPASFGPDRWDSRELRAVAELSAENTARQFLAVGRFDEARSLLATVGRRGPRIEVLEILADLGLTAAEDVDLPPPGEERDELAARLEPHVDRLEHLWGAELDRFERRPGSGDVDVFADTALLLAGHHACVGNFGGAIDHVETCCDHVDMDTPAWYFYVSALAWAPEISREELPAAESPLSRITEKASYLVAADLREALDHNHAPGIDECAGILGQLGADTDAALARTARFREVMVSTIDNGNASALEELDLDDPALSGPFGAALVRWGYELWIEPVANAVAEAGLTMEEAIGPPPEDFDEEDDTVRRRPRPRPSTWGELIDELEEHYAALVLYHEVAEACDRRIEQRVREEVEARQRDEEQARVAAAGHEELPVDPLAGDWHAARLEDALAGLGNDADLAGRIADLLVELSDPELDARWSDALAGGGAARRALGDTEADLERLRVLRRLGRDDAARGLATALFWRAVNGTLESGYDPADFALLVEELGAAEPELVPLRSALAGAGDATGAVLPDEAAAAISGSPVSVLFVGGNEIQAQYTREIDAELARRHGDRVKVQWFLTGWSARWGPEAERIESSYPVADAVVLMQFTRTQLGRRLRRSSGEAGLPWIACTGHGRGSLLRAIEHAVEVVDRARVGSGDGEA